MDIVDYFFPNQNINNISKVCSTDMLCDVYCPKTLAEFMDNKQNIKTFKNWINNKTNKNGIIISGNPGTGKTTLAKLMCSIHNRRYIHLDASCKRTKKELNEIYDKVKFSDSKIIIMDEIDSGSNGEQICMTTLLSWVDKKSKLHNIKIIFITNISCFNKVSDLINHCEHIQLTIPSNKTLFCKCLHIIESEKIDINIDLLKKYISKYNGDVRSIINNLRNIHITSSKDINLSLFQVYDLLFDSKTNISQKMIHFSSDSGTIPIIVQENYIDWNTTSDTTISIVDYMSLGDIYHHCSFFKQNQVFSTLTQDSYCVLSSLLPICKASFKKDKSNEKIRFGSIWTKLSTMYQRRKYLRNIIRTTNIHNTTSLCLFREIALTYIQNNQIDTVLDLFNVYDISNDMLNDVYKMFIFNSENFPKFPILKKKLIS
jgi:DNA polymerase III delta prime subunit